MEELRTDIVGLALYRPRVFTDDRGWFLETFKDEKYQGLFEVDNFRQDNLSCSSKGVLRGLHFQAPPFDQAKLVMVISGRVLDVVVDLRKSSPTFGQHFSIILDGKTKDQFFIPRGFAHGFYALEDETLFYYKCDNLYNTDSERTLLWNDPDLNINWRNDSPLVSEKDAQGSTWKEFDSPFE